MAGPIGVCPACSDGCISLRARVIHDSSGGPINRIIDGADAGHPCTAASRVSGCRERAATAAPQVASPPPAARSVAGDGAGGARPLLRVESPPPSEDGLDGLSGLTAGEGGAKPGTDHQRDGLARLDHALGAGESWVWATTRRLRGGDAGGNAETRGRSLSATSGGDAVDVEVDRVAREDELDRRREHHHEDHPAVAGRSWTSISTMTARSWRSTPEAGSTLHGQSRRAVELAGRRADHHPPRRRAWRDVNCAELAGPFPL